MTTKELVEILKQLGIRLQVRDDRLRYHPRSAMKPDLNKEVSFHKVKLLGLLRDLYRAPDGHWENDDDVNWSSLIVLMECPICGSLICWWDIRGGQRCMTCDPPHKAIGLMEEAERIRRQRGLPSPAGVKEHLIQLSAAVKQCD